MNTHSPFVSIIIPVFNDLERLNLCLNALENQTYPKELYEVIVVDNNSDKDIKTVVQQYTQATLTYESCQGSYAARNTGISIARGTLLGFTDSDCIPSLSWIEKGVKQLLEASDCGLVAGQINFYFQKADRPTAAELYDSVTFLNQKKYVEEEHFGATANLFTFKEVFDKVGLFNTQLKSGGDKDWGKRVFAAGYQQIYASEVCVDHPARRLDELVQKIGRTTEGHFFMNNEMSKTWRKFLVDLYWESKPYVDGILQILKDQRLTTIQQKSGYVYIYLLLRWVRAKKKLALYIQKRYLSNNEEKQARISSHS